VKNPREAAEHRARSIVLNLDRKHHLECISKGVAVPGIHEKEGWQRVSYHVAGMHSAGVQQAKIRKQYPNLSTMVINVKEQPCDWDAEIWVRLRLEEEGV
jgi:hypothetical protein